MNSIEKLAKILRADKDDLIKIDKHLSGVTGKHDMMDDLINENYINVTGRIKELGITKDVSADEVYRSLLSKAEADAEKFAEYFNHPSFDKEGSYEKFLKIVQDKTAAATTGFFLKEEKARELLMNEPPPRVMEYLGCDSISEALDKENFLEIYSSLRFLEDRDWMNQKFLKQYDSLSPDDFEERKVKVMILDKKWIKAAKDFTDKKWHNVSHLKELGIVFVIPATLGLPGELLRTAGLVSHYLHEVPFYSDMFRKIVEIPATFDYNLASLLRGDVMDRRLPEGDKTLWLVVQRYLVKDDPNDWRLFAPHINSESRHYLGAEEAIVEIGEGLDDGVNGLLFWRNAGWIGEFFKDESGNEVFVSFDLMDNAMGLVKRDDKIRFTYHQHEALWNKIFTDYFGREQLDLFLREYLLQGYFEI